MSKVDFTHTFTLPVRWGDADMLGHVNNVQYIRYLESGRIAYCDDVLDMQMNGEMEAGWILADLQSSFRQQVHYPATLEVCTRISELGNKSATILADIFRQGETTPVLTSKAVMVWFDFQQQTTARVPDEIRNKVATYEHAVSSISVD